MAGAAQFSREKYISLETFKKNGEGVKSPVWVVEDGGSLYVRTDPASWKAKRIRRDEHVRLAPSDMRGNSSGPWVDGRAHFIEGPDVERVLKLFSKKYGMSLRLIDAVNVLRGTKQRSVLRIDVA